MATDWPTPGFTARTVDPDSDLSRLLRLINACRLADGLGPLTAEFLRTVLGRPRQHLRAIADPGDPDTLIGYGVLFAQTHHRSALDVQVDPTWRRRGVGRALLADLLDLARGLGAEHASAQIREENAAGRAFVTRHGFETAGGFWVLEAPVDLPVEPPDWPAGYAVRTYAEVQNLSLYTSACNRAYRDMWGHSENTPGAVTDDVMAQWLPHWDPHAVFMAFAPDGDVAGVCHVEEGEEADEIDGPGVVPEHRAQRLQRPLVLTALAWIRRNGPRPARLLAWGDDEVTIALYRSLGLAVTRHDIAYRRDLA